MAFAAATRRRPEQTDQIVPGGGRRRRRAGLTRAATSVDLARGNASEPDARTFGTPDRSVSIPHPRRRTGEAVPRRDDLNCDEDQHWLVAADPTINVDRRRNARWRRGSVRGNRALRCSSYALPHPPAGNG